MLFFACFKRYCCCSITSVAVTCITRLLRCTVNACFSRMCRPLQLQEEQLPLDALGPLAVLSSLRCLGLQGCDASISQHCPWHCFPQLTRVDLHGSCVSDLAPLQVRQRQYMVRPLIWFDRCVAPLCASYALQFMQVGVNYVWSYKAPYSFILLLFDASPAAAAAAAAADHRRCQGCAAWT
jgi:hypothetical protein